MSPLADVAAVFVLLLILFLIYAAVTDRPREDES